jgi:hypothetical protein
MQECEDPLFSWDDREEEQQDDYLGLSAMMSKPFPPLRQTGPDEFELSDLPM